MKPVLVNKTCCHYQQNNFCTHLRLLCLDKLYSAKEVRRHETLTNSILCTLIRLPQNQFEPKRHKISDMSHYTNDVIRESYNTEFKKLLVIIEVHRRCSETSQSPSKPAIGKALCTLNRFSIFWL